MISLGSSPGSVQRWSLALALCWPGPQWKLGCFGRRKIQHWERNEKSEKYDFVYKCLNIFIYFKVALVALVLLIYGTPIPKSKSPPQQEFDPSYEVYVKFASSQSPKIPWPCSSSIHTVCRQSIATRGCLLALSAVPRLDNNSRMPKSLQNRSSLLCFCLTLGSKDRRSSFWLTILVLDSLTPMIVRSSQDWSLGWCSTQQLTKKPFLTSCLALKTNLQLPGSKDRPKSFLVPKANPQLPGAKDFLWAFCSRYLFWAVRLSDMIISS
jgi:hypothetical protein